MERLNHSNQAIQFFTQMAARTDLQQNDVLMFTWLANTLKEGVKFVIPDANMIFDGGDTTRCMELVRLPYPVTVLEYEVEGVPGEGEICAPRRIALCVSPSDPSLDAIQGLLHDVCQLPTRSDEDGIYIVAMFELDGSWFVPPILSLVRSEPDPIAPPRQTSSSGQLAQRFKMIPLPIPALFCYSGSPESIADDLLRDVHDEVNSAVTFCKLMNCSNVHEQVIPAPKAINAARARKGKLPLFEYRTLVIDVAATPDGRSDSQGGTSNRASPRQHLRRGHIRRIADRVVWVNAAVVGAHGRIEKTYSVKGGRHVA